MTLLVACAGSEMLVTRVFDFGDMVESRSKDVQSDRKCASVYELTVAYQGSLPGAHTKDDVCHCRSITSQTARTQGLTLRNGGGTAADTATDASFGERSTKNV